MSKKVASGLTPGQTRTVAEIQRIAAKLGSKTLSQSQFDEHHEIGGVTTAGGQLGSWNEAVSAAGLEPITTSVVPTRYTDDDLLREIIRVHLETGAEPSERKMSAPARISMKPYRTRWGSFSKEKAAACVRFSMDD